MNAATLIEPTAWKQIEYFTQTRRVVRHVQRNYSRPIALGEAAAIAKMECRAFSRFFEKVTGMGFAEFVRRYRLQVALRRMARANTCLQEVAFDCGYACVDSLERALRTYLGIVPGWFQSAPAVEPPTEPILLEFPAVVGS